MPVKNVTNIGKEFNLPVTGLPVLPIGHPTGVPVFAPGGQTYLEKLLTIQSANLIGLWPMDETSGSVADDKSPKGNDGAYTGVTLNDSTFLNGRPVGLWDGTNDFNNIIAVSGEFDGDAGTAAIWMKVSGVGVWTDAAVRGLMRLATADDLGEVSIIKNNAAGTMQLLRTAGGTTKNVNVTSLTSTDWIHFALTWDKVADEVKAYMDGVQKGSTQTTLGAFAGAPAAGKTNIGARRTVPQNVWDGWLAYGALWTVALTPAEILKVATV